MTELDREGILKDQDYCCKICGDKLDLGKLTHIDHCHACKQDLGLVHVRGILCHQCNTGLGFFKDKVALLARAIVYLDENDCSEMRSTS